MKCVECGQDENTISHRPLSEETLFKTGTFYHPFVAPAASGGGTGTPRCGHDMAPTLAAYTLPCTLPKEHEGKHAAIFQSVASVEGQRTGEVTRFAEFDDADHPFRKWWEEHGQYMMAGGGRKESIWAARGWIAREQLACGVEVTGESTRETSSVPGVEGMGAREWLASRGLADLSLYWPTNKPIPQIDYASGQAKPSLEELMEAYARSLRGATEQELSDQDRVIEDRNRDIIDLMACVWKPFYARPDSEGRCASCQHYAESYKEFLTIVPHSKHCKFRKLIESSNRGDGSLRGAGGEGEPDWKKLYEEIRDFSKTWQAASESREQAMRECLGKLVELLSRIEPTMYNPFEPDNQSKNYIAVKAAIENAEKLLKP